MDATQAVAALSALAQPTRLEAFRLLVRHEPDGMAAGDLARALAIPHNTLSTHLTILAHAGLVAATRHGRSVTYRATLPAFRELALFLLRDCCGGAPELCAPLIADLTPPCTPSTCLPTSEPPHDRACA